MDDIRFGRVIRALRRRRSLRQVDVARLAGVSQTTVSGIERGDLGRRSVSTVRAVARAVGADWDPAVRWRGGEVDRLIDEGHAALVGACCALLASHDWVASAEVTYSVYGERGSIDVLGRHEVTGTLLVVEVKTALMSLEETLRRHDAKARLAPRVAAERDGRRANHSARLLVLPGTSTARRKVARHAAVLDRAYPLRGAELRRWLRAPTEPISGLIFLSPNPAVTTRRRSVAPDRAARRSRSPPEPDPAPGSHPADSRLQRCDTRRPDRAEESPPR